MKKFYKKILIPALIMIIAAGLILSGCGASKSSYDIPGGYYSSGSTGFKNGFYETEMVTADAAPAEAPIDAPDYNYDYKTEDSISTMVNNLTYGENVKLIFRAYMRLQTLDFNETEKQINDMVAQCGGYFENVARNNGSYYSQGDYISCDYTVRIPAEHYDEFLNQVGTSCHVVNLQKTTEDVGLQYADNEMRLKSYQAEMDRLQELMKKATSLSDIVQLNSAITDCQYRIDNLTSTQNRYDNLIGFSTITISLEQVTQLEGSIEDTGFFATLAMALKNGALNFAESLADLIIWISYNLIGIIIAVAIIIFVSKKIKKSGGIKFKGIKFRRNKENSNDKTEE